MEPLSSFFYLFGIFQIFETNLHKAVAMSQNEVPWGKWHFCPFNFGSCFRYYGTNFVLLFFFAKRRHQSEILRSLIFTGVFLSIPSRQTSLPPPIPDETATAADDTHSTGMHSCFCFFFHYAARLVVNFTIA